jgi:hypothetical protein
MVPYLLDLLQGCHDNGMDLYSAFALLGLAATSPSLMASKNLKKRAYQLPHSEEINDFRANSRSNLNKINAYVSLGSIMHVAHVSKNPTSWQPRNYKATLKNASNVFSTETCDMTLPEMHKILKMVFCQFDGDARYIDTLKFNFLEVPYLRVLAGRGLFLRSKAMIAGGIYFETMTAGIWRVVPEREWIHFFAELLMIAENSLAPNGAYNQTESIRDIVTNADYPTIWGLTRIAIKAIDPQSSLLVMDGATNTLASAKYDEEQVGTIFADMMRKNSLPALMMNFSNERIREIAPGGAVAHPFEVFLKECASRHKDGIQVGNEESHRAMKQATDEILNELKRAQKEVVGRSGEY